MVTQITGGIHKGRKIRSVSVNGLRPTSEKIRLALFSIVGLDRIVKARVLDLYAGTGIFGLEALSRSAERADFVETNSKRCREIRSNLEKMGLHDKGHVVRASVPGALSKLDGGYNLVLVDPPYDLDPWDAVLCGLVGKDLLSENAIVIAEHRANQGPFDRYGRLVRVKKRRHGDTEISLFELEGMLE